VAVRITAGERARGGCREAPRRGSQFSASRPQRQARGRPWATLGREAPAPALKWQQIHAPPAGLHTSPPRHHQQASPSQNAARRAPTILGTTSHLPWAPRRMQEPHAQGTNQPASPQRRHRIIRMKASRQPAACCEDSCSTSRVEPARVLELGCPPDEVVKHSS
jgi:hypothetical protein